MAGIISLVRDVDWGKPLSWSMEPRARLNTYAHHIGRGNPFQNLWNTTLGEIHYQPSTSNYGSQPITSQQAQYLYTGHDHGFYQNPGQKPNFSWQLGASRIPGSFPPVHTQKPKLPFLATLHLLDLSRLLNGPICHDPCWPPMLTKFPSDIPKFEGKPNEDPGNHVTTFHLWYSSNSLRDEFVQLCMFQRTLIRSATKWYIELDHSRYSTFCDLTMLFFNHFQLPVRYDADTKFLANFEKTKADHILDHIREW
jgi:hypothetical protein